MVNGVSFLIITFIKVIRSRFFPSIVSFFRAFPKISSIKSNINLTTFKDQQVVNQNVTAFRDMISTRKLLYDK